MANTPGTHTRAAPAPSRGVGQGGQHMITQEILNELENPGRLVNNQQTIESLQRAVLNAPRDLNILRSDLAEALRCGAWQDRLDTRRGKRFTYSADQFLTFITDPLPRGLDTTPKILRSLIEDDS